MKDKPEYIQNWLTRPSFLIKPKHQWPKKNVGNEVYSMEDSKFVAVVTEQSSCLPYLKKLSKWTKLVRATDWIFRFINNIKISTERKHERKTVSGLLPEEIDRVEKKWIKIAQKDDFESEIEDLRKLREVMKESRLYQLTPYLDEGNIIRMSERLNYDPNLNDNYYNPIILHPTNELTRFLINFYHEKNFHQGQETVVNMLRKSKV
ncbi:hypothetical protein JTB14_036891 [Gonioctena quinquepunctata]|nr:hypothetical protein JTB14_036891 [Gonioctena quinquepunctata]